MINGYGDTLTRRRPLSRFIARDSVVRRLDWTILVAMVALSVVGSLLVWSATRMDYGDAFVKKHILNICIGLVICVVVTLVDYRLLRAYAPIVYALSCAGLLVVLTPFGATVNGSHSWIAVGGGFEVQPSEFAKVGLIALLAMLLGEPRDGGAGAGPARRDVLLALGLAVVPAGLVMLEPDLGIALVFGAIVFGMLVMSGVSRLWTLGLIGGGAGAAAVMWLSGLLKPYQLKRLTAFADSGADPRGAGYNAEQARITVGSGGVFGKGLFHGSQTTGHFVPEQHTDFIFTAAGEELGFVGCIAILVLLGIILWRALRIAFRAADLFGTLLATGVVCWLAFQTFENAGMTMGIMPITGLPLPFVSYGGSATFANMAALGILQAVHLRRRPFD